MLTTNTHVITTMVMHYMHISILFDVDPTKEIDIQKSITNIINVLAGFAGAASALAILRAGYVKIFSGDNYNNQSQFYSMIAAAVVGLIVCLGAVTINNLIFAGIVNK